LAPCLSPVVAVVGDTDNVGCPADPLAVISLAGSPVHLCKHLKIALPAHLGLGAVEPSPMHPYAVLFGFLQDPQRNYTFFLRLRPKCMIGDLGLGSEVT
jgi:hypothetical protein